MKEALFTGPDLNTKSIPHPKEKSLPVEQRELYTSFFLLTSLKLKKETIQRPEKTPYIFYYQLIKNRLLVNHAGKRKSERCLQQLLNKWTIERVKIWLPQLRSCYEQYDTTCGVQNCIFLNIWSDIVVKTKLTIRNPVVKAQKVAYFVRNFHVEHVGISFVPRFFELYLPLLFFTKIRVGKRSTLPEGKFEILSFAATPKSPRWVVFDIYAFLWFTGGIPNKVIEWIYYFPDKLNANICVNLLLGSIILRTHLSILITCLWRANNSR